jgi:oligopeptidase A
MSFNNPLLTVQTDIPFDKIKPEHFVPAARKLVSEAKARIKEIAKDPASPTFENTMLSLERVTEKMTYLYVIGDHLSAVADSEELRNAWGEAEPMLTSFFTEITLQADIWSRIKEYSLTDEAKGLIGERARFLAVTMDEFRSSGADLDVSNKKKFFELNLELKTLTTKFSENVIDATKAFEVIITDEQELDGIPENARQAAKESARSKGKDGWRFTLQMPSYSAVLKYSKNGELRKKMFFAYVNRCYGGEFDNTGTVRRILQVRKEKALLLGFKDFADLNTSRRMAKTGSNAKDFVEKLIIKTWDARKKEFNELSDFFRSEAVGNYKMFPWDTSYYAVMLQKKLYEFDSESLRPYLEFERALSGVFEVSSKLYGLRFLEDEGAPVWDKSAKRYSVYDKNGKRIGIFYTDFSPRENKRGGAWMNILITGGPRKDGFDPHVGLICGNFSPPTEGSPSLLSFGELETLFHEFGHLLHHILGNTEIRSLGQSTVAWDFIELPSQIMENWCMEREVLDMFALHHKTGEKIPEELYRKMLRTRNFQSAMSQIGQLSYAAVDLALHINYDPYSTEDPVEFASNIFRQLSLVERTDMEAIIPSFGHLFSEPVGYAAGYYSYKWAEVLAADAFSRFAKEGVFNGQTAAEFRELLAKGNSEPPEDIFRKFMGRDPDPEALLKALGIEQE